MERKGTTPLFSLPTNSMILIDSGSISISGIRWTFTFSHPDNSGKGFRLARRK